MSNTQSRAQEKHQGVLPNLRVCVVWERLEDYFEKQTFCSSLHSAGARPAASAARGEQAQFPLCLLGAINGLK
jgi:hypothetical protein